MAKKQPTLIELTELLFKQVVYLQETMKQNIAQQTELSKRIKNIEVKVNVSELKKVEEEQTERLHSYLNHFCVRLQAINEQHYKLNRSINSKKILYLVLLNIFFFLVACLCIYKLK
ncbi:MULTISPECIES: hypothetical protein [Myroides]|uniref:hypothetical protein n=1 Tax=Myroides TaxID=76831 RepID=UPI0015FBEBC9|nr:MULTISPECIES: hypothetical protein [Myroides]MBB1139026.1 hypothetical protein [Myroides sp. WP-1]MDM1035950.1 hypothetical protein [Myroides odoratimimus]MDM1060137.1 hypothetical protein [Myroides odoratimimus]